MVNGALALIMLLRLCGEGISSLAFPQSLSSGRRLLPSPATTLLDRARTLRPLPGSRSPGGGAGSRAAHPQTAPYIPRRWLTARDDAVHPETTAHSPRRRRTSRDDGSHPETTAYIPRQ